MRVNIEDISGKGMYRIPYPESEHNPAEQGSYVEHNMTGSTYAIKMIEECSLSGGETWIPDKDL
jgi:hypothetical protein